MKYSCPLFALLFIVSVSAQESNSLKLFEAYKTNNAPIIDGVINEDEWSNATVISDFHQILPIEFSEPSKITEVRVMFDEDALYVAAIMLDQSAESINSQVLRQGEVIWSDDFFSVIIDPFNDRRTGYRFITNPNGLRLEASYEDTTRQQWNWMGIWETNASIDERGWYSEIRIPFKSIPFDENADQWGINFRRTVGRNNEDIGWVSRNQTQDPSVVGSMSGLTGLNSGMGIEVVPSFSASNERNMAEVYIPEMELESSELQPSLDLSYRITPSLNISATLNTDFSATEVDDRQVDLSRFSLFFPEKRTFFLRDSDVFEFGRLAGGGFRASSISRPSLENGKPFFSRSIGLNSDGSPADINYGAKLSGRAGNFNIGSLFINQTDTGNGLEQDLMVTRLSYNVLRESSIGVIATHGNPGSEVDNSLMGVDFRYLNSMTPFQKPILAEVWWQESNTEGLNEDQQAFGYRLQMPANSGLRGSLGSKTLEENFNPALGYTNRTNVRDNTLELGYTLRFDHPIIRSYFVGLLGQDISYLSGPVQSKVFTFTSLDVETNYRDRLTIRHNEWTENLITPFEISDGVTIDEGQYTFSDHSLSFATGPQRLFSGDISITNGDFYTGSRTRVGAGVLWTPSRHFRASSGYTVDDIELPEGSFKVRLARFKVDTIFSSTLSWTNLIQYDNVSETAGINSRLHWIPQAGREVFLVINHNLQDWDLDNRFKSYNSTSSLKVNYTVQF